MNSKNILILFLLTPVALVAQMQYKVETADIRHFWNAFDHLAKATTTADSIDIFQQEYIGAATPDFKKFLKARDFTAEEYVHLISAVPAFWTSVRPLTEQIANRTEEIDQMFDSLSQVLPGFKKPDVCFAIGCLRTGGTTSKDLILVGAEIAAANATVDKRGLNAWLQSVLGKSGDIVSMVAHEAVHTRQRGFPMDEFFSLLSHRKLKLLNMSITEGSADFITSRFLGRNINADIHAYGVAHKDDLWREFQEDMRTSPYDYSPWLYNGNQSQGRPADLGYYIGCMIAQGFYDRASNKEKALKTLMRRGKYKKVFHQSGYSVVADRMEK